MHPNLSQNPDTSQVPCEKCGSLVWRARFGSGELRSVEPAPKVRTNVGRLLRERTAGHVGLTLPLPGTGAEVLGFVTRKLTAYRLHTCRAFSAHQSTADRKAATK